MKIYVNFPAPRTLRDFIKKFFSGPKGWGAGYSVHTYRDKECKFLQCPEGRNRSIQDLWDCVRTYYPDTTLHSLIKELIIVRPHGNQLFPYTCCTIKRPVVSFCTYKYTGAGFKYLPRVTTSEFSWGRLIRELGINSVKELYEYKG